MVLEIKSTSAKDSIFKYLIFQLLLAQGMMFCELKIYWVALFYCSLITCIASLVYCQKFACLWIIFIAETSVDDGQFKYLI